MTAVTQPIEAAAGSVAARKRGGGFQRLLVHVVIVGLMILWFVPTLGLLVNSFRPAAAVATRASRRYRGVHAVDASEARQCHDARRRCD